jgi:hypothetical protein
MSGAAGGLEQIEKDIMLCEQFLSTDKFVKGRSARVSRFSPQTIAPPTVPCSHPLPHCRGQCRFVGAPLLGLAARPLPVGAVMEYSSMPFNIRSFLGSTEGSDIV